METELVVQTIDHRHRDTLLEYLRQDPANNAWHIANLCCLPLGKLPRFLQYGAYVDGQIEGTIQIFYGLSQVYWQDEAVLPELARLVARHRPQFLTGLKVQIQPLLSWLADKAAIDQEPNLFCRLNVENFRGKNLHGARQAEKTDTERLIEFYRKVSFTRTFIEAEERIIIAMDHGTCFLLEQEGQIVSAAHTPAEAPESAQIMGVATLPGYEGRGYATSLMVAFCQYLLDRGKQVYLNYKQGNIPAEKVYQEKIGFRPIADWEAARIA